MINVFATGAAIRVAARHVPRSKCVVNRMCGYGLPADLKRVLHFKNEPRFVLALVDVKTAAHGLLAVSINAYAPFV